MTEECRGGTNTTQNTTPQTGAPNTTQSASKIHIDNWSMRPEFTEPLSLLFIPIGTDWAKEGVATWFLQSALWWGPKPASLLVTLILFSSSAPVVRVQIRTLCARELVRACVRACFVWRKSFRRYFLFSVSCERLFSVLFLKPRLDEKEVWGLENVTIKLYEG